MRKHRLLVALILVLGCGVVGFYAVEADKEARILCGLFTPGTSALEMDRVLGTADFLRVVETRTGGQASGRAPSRLERVVHSRWNLGRTGCRVALEDGAVVSNETWVGFGKRAPGE